MEVHHFVYISVSTHVVYYSMGFPLFYMSVCLSGFIFIIFYNHVIRRENRRAEKDEFNRQSAILDLCSPHHHLYLLKQGISLFESWFVEMQTSDISSNKNPNWNRILNISSYVHTTQWERSTRSIPSHCLANFCSPRSVTPLHSEAVRSFRWTALPIAERP